jgi:hypothetical protein
MLLAGASGVMGYQFILPGWGWALIAVGCAFWIAWRAERELYDEKHSKIECDMAFVDVVASGANLTLVPPIRRADSPELDPKQTSQKLLML